MWLDIFSSDVPNTLWWEGVSYSIAFIFNSRDQMRSSSLHYIGCKVLLYCKVALGLAPGCAYVYAACSILLRPCARIRIVRIFFLFISAAGSLFNGSWNGAYLHTLFKYSQLKYPHSAYIIVYIYAQRQNIYVLCIMYMAAVSGSSLRPLLQCPKMSTWAYIYILYIIMYILCAARYGGVESSCLWQPDSAHKPNSIQ